MANSPDTRSALLDRIREGIRAAEAQTIDLKKKNSRYITTGIAASAFSTVIAGTVAAVGPIIGQGAPAWKLTCGFIALCTGVATVAGGLQKQHNVSERFAKAAACTGKLRSLEFALTVANRKTPEVANEYESVIAGYSDVLS